MKKKEMIEMTLLEMTTIYGGDWFDDVVNTVNDTIDSISEVWDEAVTSVNDFIDGLADPISD
ncbi:hypothetical protein [Aquimarina amphilecti]|nr:hypothetical protein [Aquimarina amphilecti]